MILLTCCRMYSGINRVGGCSIHSMYKQARSQSRNEPLSIGAGGTCFHDSSLPPTIWDHKSLPNISVNIPTTLTQSPSKEIM